MSQEHGKWQQILNPSGLSLDKVTRQTKKFLAVEIEDEEKAVVAEEICETYLLDVRLEEEKKAWLEKWKEKVQANEAERAKLVDVIMTGKRLKEVECLEVFDHTDRSYYLLHKGDRYQERLMKDSEYLIGQPELFDNHIDEPPAESNVAEIRPGATLVASSDGTTTKVSKRLKQQINLKPVHNNEINEVFNEETNRKKKFDHVTD